MKISKQTRREAKELFKSCLANGLLDESRARQAVQRVLDQRPRGYLALLSQFQRLVKLNLDRRSARIESAVAVSDAEKASISSRLNQRYGGNLIFSFRQEPSLIGGLRIRVGSDVYDGSVKARLAALEQAL